MPALLVETDVPRVVATILVIVVLKVVFVIVTAAAAFVVSSVSRVPACGGWW